MNDDNMKALNSPDDNDLMLREWLLEKDSDLSIARPSIEAFRKFMQETAIPEYTNSDFMYGYLSAIAVILSGIYGPMSAKQRGTVCGVLNELLTWASERRAAFDLTVHEGNKTEN